MPRRSTYKARKPLPQTQTQAHIPVIPREGGESSETIGAERVYYVYILANRRIGTLYVGVTNDLVRRVYQHRNRLIPGFTSRYHVHDLVYYEATESILSAIRREKRIKKWNRAWKIRLIEEFNPGWVDLYDSLL